MGKVTYSDMFDVPASPCGDSRIDEIEKNIGRRLPKSYRELIKSTGGGIVSSEAAKLPMRSVRDPDEDAWFLDRIYGNGSLRDGDGEDIALDSPYLRGLIHEYGISDKLLVFCELEGGLDECLAINYGMLRYPPHSIILVDSEVGKTKLVARSFSSFLNRLREEEEPEWLIRSKLRAKSGEFSEELRQVMDVSCLTSEVLREQARRVVKEQDNFVLRGEDEGYVMRDILFLGMSQFRQICDKKDYVEDPVEGPSYISMFGLVDEEDDDERFGPGICSPLFEYKWWDKRAEEGKIVSTEHGYKFADWYEAEVVMKVDELSGK